ncbi:MAG: FHA domain-containing protein [Oligoflexia bacterium]|nr:FHA domain-containing protein [Oligoflexia bacterium]
MGAALKLKMAAVPRQQGERARLKVVRGPDYGVTYVITGGRATVGRGEENDIVISDLKASRRHAEIAWGASGWEVRDLGSANGILHNGKSIRAGGLGARDTLTIGETTFEFVTSDQPTRMLAAPPKPIEQRRQEDSAYDEQKKRVRALANFGAPPGMVSAPGPVKAGEGGGRRMLVLGVIGIGAALMLFGEELLVPKKPPPKKKVESSKGSDLGKYLPESEPAGQVKSSDLFFKLGFREYTQGNFLRAKTQFETALQIAPGNAMAALYLRNCEARIKEEVEIHLRTGKKSLDSGKLREARAHFEQTMRLLFRDQTNPHFIEAKEQLEAVRKLLRTDSEEAG